MPASLDSLGRAARWAEMARGERPIGKVRARRRARGERFYLDSGRKGKVYSFRGVTFESKDMAQAMLSHIQVEHAKGRPLDDVLSEFQPETSSHNSVDKMLDRWLQLMRDKTEHGDRSPTYLRELERWARPSGHFSFWYGRSLFEIDEGSVEEWSYWLARRKLSQKTRRNILAGFHSFLKWVSKQRRALRIPDFEWPTPVEHIPTTVTREIQTEILEAIPIAKRGIFIALADLMLRPGEARALRIEDWKGEEVFVCRAVKGRRLDSPIRGPKKASGTKVLPLAHSPKLLNWLEEQVPAALRLRDPSGFLYRNPDGTSASGQWSEASLRRTWYAACRKVGVKVGLYEGTKHSTATALKAEGVDDRTLATIMGHSDPRSVAYYGKIADRTVRSALAHLTPAADRG